MGRVFTPAASARFTFSDSSLRSAPAFAHGETPFRMTVVFFQPHHRQPNPPLDRPRRRCFPARFMLRFALKLLYGDRAKYAMLGAIGVRRGSGDIS